MGNIVNRVFDSSGPEGKVRGTPQQVIDKYNQLARDAALGNDPVATENFQQHAEHYTRMLNEAQREQNERREQQEREQTERREREERERAERRERQEAAPDSAREGDAATGVIDIAGDEGQSGLVETPESQPARQRRGRKPKSDAPKPEGGSPKDAESSAEAAE